jgi:CheY-like chemotaxis protein
MDMMMPVMNGEEATRTIRKLERPDAKTIPIIAATANAFAEDIEAAISAGMNDHLAKPLDVTPLKQMITKYVVSPQGA